jgi:hypothetical protein
MASLTSTQLINQLAVCQMAALLLENGADVNARNIYGQVVNCGFCLESFSQSKLFPLWILDFVLLKSMLEHTGGLGWGLVLL